ncbi:hypothetical protein [Streptococcus suis]|uniref:Uncharacterized protein n=1 Tax=Streptococcus suis TaxID=1307 RepID=A0A0Z8JN44_STRSU|nr:hypothetical protein [Streptococcus suis]ANC99095.1 hypothetical protein A6M16_00675 [Streptococcus suis]AOM73815.1 hypothetical protein BFP66_00565 [Streptococcus suis]MBL6516087.1 hypothetical protein [Streptococcus suis]MBS8059384.1 hypothetical protein [Streptococcus suis]MBS8114784.1 hypothetical protein [Streptococcus suis]
MKNKTFHQLQSEKIEREARVKKRAEFLKSHQKNYTKMIAELAHMIVHMNDGNPTDEAIVTISSRITDDIVMTAKQFKNTARIFERNGK